MKTLLLAISAIALGMGAASADPVKDREAIMKERAGLMKQIVPMAKGDAAFDASAALALLTQLGQNAKKGTVEELFPEGSQEGSEASPQIWEAFEAYKTEWNRYAEITTAAVAAAPQSQAALQEQVGKIGTECGSCHQKYRIKD